MTACQLTGPFLRPAWILLLVAAFPFLALPGRSQTASDPLSPVPAAGMSNQVSGFVDASGLDTVRSRMLRTMARQRDQQRQKAIVDDTTQLLVLAEQLKTAVDQSDKNRISVAAIHAAAQIEKLAKTVEKKMRDTD